MIIDSILEKFWPATVKDHFVQIEPHDDIPPSSFREECEKKYAEKRAEAKKRLGEKYILASSIRRADLFNKALIQEALNAATKEGF